MLFLDIYGYLSRKYTTFLRFAPILNNFVVFSASTKIRAQMLPKIYRKNREEVKYEFLWENLGISIFDQSIYRCQLMN